MSNKVFVIEEGVTIPESKQDRFFRTKRYDAYPFLQMKVNQSFLLDKKKSYSSVYAYAKKCGVKITIREQDGNKARVWLTDNTNKINQGE